MAARNLKGGGISDLPAAPKTDSIAPEVSLPYVGKEGHDTSTHWTEHHRPQGEFDKYALSERLALVTPKAHDALSRMKLHQQHQAAKQSLKPSRPSNMAGPKRPATAGPQGRALKAALRKPVKDGGTGRLTSRSMPMKRGATKHPLLSTHVPGFATARSEASRPFKTQEPVVQRPLDQTKESTKVAEGSNVDPHVVITTTRKDDSARSKNAPLKALSDSYTWIDPAIAQFFDLVDDNPDTSAMLIAVPLHREDPSLRFNPYALRVVQKSASREVTGYLMDKYPEFFTFSALGVTFYQIRDEDGNTLDKTDAEMDKSKLRGNAEFTPLWEWETELFAYCRLMETHVFAKFPIWMFFNNWGKAAKRSKFERMQAKLHENMLKTDPLINKLLFGVQLRLLQVQNIPLIAFKDREPWTASDFGDMQEEHQKVLVHRIETIVEDTTELASRSCHMVLDSKGCPFVEFVNKDDRGNHYWRDAAQRRTICLRFFSLFKLMQLMVEQELDDTINRYASSLLGCLDGNFSRDVSALVVSDGGWVKEGKVWVYKSDPDKPVYDEVSALFQQRIKFSQNLRGRVVLSTSWGRTDFYSTTRRLQQRLLRMLGTIETITYSDLLSDFVGTATNPHHQLGDPIQKPTNLREILMRGEENLLSKVDEVLLQKAWISANLAPESNFGKLQDAIANGVSVLYEGLRDVMIGYNETLARYTKVVEWLKDSRKNGVSAGALLRAFRLLEFDSHRTQYERFCSMTFIDAKLADATLLEVRAMRSSLEAQNEIHNVGVFLFDGADLHAHLRVAPTESIVHLSSMLPELFVQRGRNMLTYYFQTVYGLTCSTSGFGEYFKQMELYLATRDRLENDEKDLKNLRKLFEIVQANTFVFVPSDAEAERRTVEKLEAMESGQAKLREEVEDDEDEDESPDGEEDGDQDAKDGEDADDCTPLTKEKIANITYPAAKALCKKLGLGLKGGLKQLKLNLEEYLRETNEAPVEVKLLKKLNTQFDQISVAVTSVRIVLDGSLADSCGLLDEAIKQLHVSTSDFANDVNAPALMSDDTPSPRANTLIDDLKPKMEALAANVEDLIAFQRLVNRYIELSGDREKENMIYESVEEFHEALTLREQYGTQRLLWSSMSSIESTLNSIQSATLEDLDTESINNDKVETLSSNVKVLEIASGQIQKPVGKLRSEVRTVSLVLQTIRHLQNPNLNPSHWKKILTLLPELEEKLEQHHHQLASNTSPLHHLSVDVLLEHNLLDISSSIHTISNEATGALLLDRAVRQVELSWDDGALFYAPFDISDTAHHQLYNLGLSDLLKVSNLQNFFSRIDHCLDIINSISSGLDHSGSESVELSEQLTSWRNRLETLEEVLRNIETIQDAIAFAMPVYLIDDVRLLIDAGNVFQAVCTEFIEVLRALRHVKSRLDLKFSLEPEICDKILNIATNTALLKTHISDWLVKVKASSPRLYLLGDEDVMRLSYYSDAGSLHDLHNFDRYLNAMFHAAVSTAWGHTKDVEGSESGSSGPLQYHAGYAINNDDQDTQHVLLGVSSSHMVETLLFNHPVHGWGPFSRLVNSVETQIRQSLISAYERCMEIRLDHESIESIMRLIVQVPGQPLILAAAIQWIANFEELLVQHDGQGSHPEHSATVQCMHDTVQQMHKLVMTIVKLNKRKPPPPQTAKLNAFILQQVSFRDLAEHLHSSGVTDADDFEWKCRLKYRHLPSDASKSQETGIGISAGGDWSVAYAFEYYGENARLVVTPTAERVLVRLCYAMRQWCGGVLQGTDGGANLNVVSEFATMIGRPIVQVTGSSMTQEKTLVDLLHLSIGIGAIGCIQFIDRLPKALHSKIGEMLHSIREAVKAKELHCKLDPTSRITDKFCPHMMAPGADNHIQLGVFVQCSIPYSGDHTQLPPTIHSHFRPVTVSLPPLELVVRMLLHSEGFVEVDPIAAAVVDSLEGCSDISTSIVLTDMQKLNVAKIAIRAATDLLRSDKLSQAGGRRRGRTAGASRRNTGGKFQRPAVAITRSYGASKNVSQRTIIQGHATKENEEKAMYYALREKLLAFFPADASSVEGILKDQFKKYCHAISQDRTHTKAGDELRKLVTDVMRADGKDITPAQLDAAVQIWDGLHNSESAAVIIVGPAGTGKTTLQHELLGVIRRKEVEFRQETTAFITKRMSNISEAMKARSSRTITGFFKRIRVRKMRESLLLAIRRNIAGYSASDENAKRSDINFDHLRIGSLTQETLIGTVDDRGTWNDGMLLKRLKTHCRIAEDRIRRNRQRRLPESTMKSRWQAPTSILVLDGPVTEGLESLINADVHSYLNSGERNRKVVAPSGATLLLPDELYITLETDSLSNMSPTTAAACTIVVVECDINNLYRSIWQNWLHRRIEACGYCEPVELLLHSLFGALSIKAMSGALMGSATGPSVDHEDTPIWVSKANSMLSILEPALDLVEPKDDKRSFTRIRLVFAFAAIWGIAGDVDKLQGRITFSNFMRKICEERNGDFKVEANANLFDYFVDIQAARLVHFDSRRTPNGVPLNLLKQEPSVIPGKHPTALEYLGNCPSLLFVPSVRTCAVTALATLMLQAGLTPYVAGERGCGKTALVLHILRHFSETEHLAIDPKEMHGDVRWAVRNLAFYRGKSEEDTEAVTQSQESTMSCLSAEQNKLNLIASMEKMNLVPLYLDLSSFANSSELGARIVSKLPCTDTNTAGPSAGKHAILFIDDMHVLEAKDAASDVESVSMFEHVSANELANFVRDLVDITDECAPHLESASDDCVVLCENSGLNRVVHLPHMTDAAPDSMPMRTKNLSRVSTVVAGTVRSSRRLNGRYLRHLSSLALLEPEENELQQIGGTLFNAIFTNSPVLHEYYNSPSSNGQNVPAVVQAHMPALISATVRAVKLIGNLDGSPTAGRYSFDMAAFTRTLRGFALANGESQSWTTKQLIRLWAHECVRELCDGFRSQAQKASGIEVLSSLTPVLGDSQRDTDVLKRAICSDIPFLWAEMLQMTGSSKEFEEGNETAPMEYREICALQESMFQAKQSSAALSAIGNLRNSIMQNAGGGGRKMSRMSVSSVMTDLSEAYGMKSVMSILKRQRQELSEDEDRDVPQWVSSFLISEHTSEHVVRLLRLMRVSRGHILLVGPPHVGQVPMVYFAAEIAGFHVTHIDGGMVESVKDARTTCWKAAILEAVEWVLMNPSSHLLLLVSQISDLPIKYVRILEELVASGDVEHLLNDSDLKLIARALTQSYVLKAASSTEAAEGPLSQGSHMNITSKALRLRIGEALRRRMTVVLAAEREEAQGLYHNEAQFTKFQKFCTVLTLRPIAGADIASGSHESLSDEGTTTTMEHILNSSTLLDAVMGSASVRRLHEQLLGSANKKGATAKIDELIAGERQSLRRDCRKKLLRFRSKMFDVAYEKIMQSRLCTHWVIPPQANEQLVTLHAQMVNNITIWFPEQRQRLKHCYELTKYIIDYMEKVNEKVETMSKACDTFRERYEAANQTVATNTKDYEQLKEHAKSLDSTHRAALKESKELTVKLDELRGPVSQAFLTAREAIDPAKLSAADMLNAKKDAEEGGKITGTIIFLMFKALKAATKKGDVDIDVRVAALEHHSDMIEHFCEPWLLQFAHSIDESFMAILTSEWHTEEVKSFWADGELSVEAASKQSHAAGALCGWITAMKAYAEAMPEIQKHEVEGAALAAKASTADNELTSYREKTLQVAETELTTFKVEVAHMESKDSQDREDLVRLQAMQSQGKEVLLGVAEMCAYYEVELTQYNSMRDTLVGDTIVFAAAICYAPHCPFKIRRELVMEWRDILRSANVHVSSEDTVVGNLLEPMQFRLWCTGTSQVLPCHPAFQDAAAIALSTPRWPLIVDPESIAKLWLTSFLKGRQTTLLKTKAGRDVSYQVLKDWLIGGKLADKTDIVLLVNDVDHGVHPDLLTFLAAAPYEMVTVPDDPSSLMKYGAKPGTTVMRVPMGFQFDDLFVNPGFRIILLSKTPVTQWDESIVVIPRSTLDKITVVDFCTGLYVSATAKFANQAQNIEDEMTSSHAFLEAVLSHCMERFRPKDAQDLLKAQDALREGEEQLWNSENLLMTMLTEIEINDESAESLLDNKGIRDKLQASRIGRARFRLDQRMARLKEKRTIESRSEFLDLARFCARLRAMLFQAFSVFEPAYMFVPNILNPSAIHDLLSNVAEDSLTNVEDERKRMAQANQERAKMVAKMRKNLSSMASRGRKMSVLRAEIEMLSSDGQEIPKEKMEALSPDKANSSGGEEQFTTKAATETFDAWQHDRDVLLAPMHGAKAKGGNLKVITDLQKVVAVLLISYTDPNSWWVVVLAVVSARYHHTSNQAQLQWDCLLNLCTPGGSWTKVDISDAKSQARYESTAKHEAAPSPAAVAIGSPGAVIEEGDSEEEDSESESSSSDDESVIPTRLALDSSTPGLEWLTEEAKLKLTYAGQVSAHLASVWNHIAEFGAAWGRWCKHLDSSDADLLEEFVLHPPFGEDNEMNSPGGAEQQWDGQVDRIEAIVLIACLCPGKLPKAVQLLFAHLVPKIEEAFRLESVLDIGALYQYSTPNLANALYVPVESDCSILDRSMQFTPENLGSSSVTRTMPLNPMREIEMTARHLGIKMMVLSMQEGLRKDTQKRILLEALKIAMAEGQWLVLENCDIFPSVMQEVFDVLLRITTGLTEESTTPLSPGGRLSPSGVASSRGGHSPGHGHMKMQHRRFPPSRTQPLVKAGVGGPAASRARKVSFLGSIDNLSNLKLKKSHETKLAGYKARFEFAQKSVTRHLKNFGKPGKGKSCASSFRLWLLCRWPDSFVTTDGALEGGTSAPCRIPMAGYPGIIGSAHVSYTNAPMPMLVGKHGMEISSARAFLERSEVKKYDEYTELTDHAMGVFQAQIEMCAEWTDGTKVGLHELETCILEAADLMHQLATPTLRSWHKGNKDNKDFSHVMFHKWTQTANGIAKHVFGYMRWNPKQSFSRAKGAQHNDSDRQGQPGEEPKSEDDLVSLFVKIFTPPHGHMWDLWSWLNTLKEQQDNPALDLVKLRSPRSHHGGNDRFSESGSNDSSSSSSSDSDSEDGGD